MSDLGRPVWVGHWDQNMEATGLESEWEGRKWKQKLQRGCVS